MSAPTPMVPAYPVVVGRCPHCGHEKRVWTAGRILEAIREFNAERGRAPFRREWVAATPHNPSASTVRAMFGSWRDAIRVAGLATPPRSNTARHWTRDEAIQAIFTWRYELGQLPTAEEWEIQETWRPSSHQVARLFGSWNAAIEAAGYEPRRSSKRISSAAAGGSVEPVPAAAGRTRL